MSRESTSHPLFGQGRHNLPIAKVTCSNTSELSIDGNELSLGRKASVVRDLGGKAGKILVKAKANVVAMRSSRMHQL